MPPMRRAQAEPISRVRTGCFTCRRRKKKCDEAKPVCAGCARNKLSCAWPTSISESTSTNSPRSPSLPGQNEQHASSSSSSSSSSPHPSDLLPVSPGDTSLYAELMEEPPLTDLQSGLLGPVRHSSIAEVPAGGGSGMGMDMMPRTMSMLPGYDPECFQLLNHYLGTTADCMANGSTPINPFLVQVVPLAFSSDLLLQLVLTQSAAHRAFRSKRDVDDMANSHYTKALRLFRSEVTEFIDGKGSNPLLLTVGALMMCFTETAKGDMNGTVFNHLSAANSLLVQLLVQSNAAIPKDLECFVIEYYTYTATVSMISIDARAGSQRLLDSEMERRASQLVASKYVGSLSGCWLELLLMIPRIFDLGQRWMVQDDQPCIPTADDIVVFGSLQAEIVRWTPYDSVPPEVHLAGLIFRQATLLYLVTALGMFSEGTDSAGQRLIDSVIVEATTLLRQIPATSRINSGLCWPIAVVGSCLTNPEQQDELRQRLTTMGNTFGLGNMHRTLLLLEHMWQLPLHDAGPWNICRVMQQTQIWISFA